MANNKTNRLKKLEEVHADNRRAVLATYVASGAVTDFDAAVFTVGAVTGLTYDRVMNLGYESVSFMPKRDSSM